MAKLGNLSINCKALMFRIAHAKARTLTTRENRIKVK